MVSRSRRTNADAAQDRARQLAGRFPEAREALEFCAAILTFEGDWRALRALVHERAPSQLREAASSLTEPVLQDATARYLRGEDCESPMSFFARVLLRHSPPQPGSTPLNRCPACAQPPQCGCLHPEGHGSTFFLVCSGCETEWRYPRAQCPACGEAAVFYSSERIPHITTQACEHCRRYLHVIDLGKEPAAVPLLDEVAALALDHWMRESGFQKIHPNLIGM